MTDVTFSDEITVKLIRHMGGDESVIQAAQVSAKGENNPGTEMPRLINALMAGKHGSPFEHNAFTFFVKAPLFVFREWMRHRVSSYNEWSGRYSDMLPEFYVPGVERGLVNIGTKMKPSFLEGSHHQRDSVNHFTRQTSYDAWEAYQQMLKDGIANEVARIVLPLNTYSQMYWTVNARSMMNFLSLRGDQTGARVESFPQREIQMGAEQVETSLFLMMPHTHAAFIANGRVAP